MEQTELAINNLIGEIAAINEEISEFAMLGYNVAAIIEERNRLVQALEKHLLS